MKKLIKHTSLLTFGLLLCVVTVSSQGLQVPDYEEKLTYTEFETDYYVLDQKDLDKVSLADKVKFKEIKYEREYEKYLNDLNHRTTIIRHISSENIYEDWMIEPEIVLIDKDGVALLSSDGRELNRIEHTPVYLKMLPEHENGLFPRYEVPNAQQLRQMKEAGFEVVDLGDGFIQITNQSVQNIFNEEKLYIERNKLNQDGEVMYSLKTEFMRLPDGALVIQKIRESKVVTLNNNIRAEHVYLRLYSNYEFEDKNVIVSSETSKEELNIHLNSDHSQVVLDYEPLSKNVTSYYTIYSTNGRLMKAYSIENSGINQIDISDLIPGVYIIRVQNGDKTIAKKFIKMQN
jgi:hypothetical protein